jgi:hypothetical protein
MRAPGGASGAGTAYAKKLRRADIRMARNHKDIVGRSRVGVRGSCLAVAWSVFESWGSYVTRLLQSESGRALPTSVQARPPIKNVTPSFTVSLDKVFPALLPYTNIVRWIIWGAWSAQVVLHAH